MDGTLSRRNHSGGIVKSEYHDTEQLVKYSEQKEWYEPNNLNKYVKIIFNVIITSSLLFIAYQFVHLISLDVEWKLNELQREQLEQLRHCQWKYESNKCHLPNEEIPPHLQTLCLEWVQCIEKYNSVDGRHRSQSAKLWVQTLAEVVNSFVENITLRSLLFILITICSVVIVTNTIFGSYRVVYYNK